MAGMSECVHWGAELKVRKVLQKSENAAQDSVSLYLQKEKKGGFLLLPQSQVRGMSKCKGRSQLRILSVGYVCVFFLLCSSFFIVKQNNCSQRELLSWADFWCLSWPLNHYQPFVLEANNFVRANSEILKQMSFSDCFGPWNMNMYKWVSVFYITKDLQRKLVCPGSNKRVRRHWNT